MFNCEFQRNLWLEFTPARAAIAPAVAVVITYIIYLANSPDMSKFYESLTAVSGVILAFLLFLWGLKQAAESVMNEVGERTWVFQMMSSISAWDMAVGKLFGSTVYVWYTSAFFVLAYIFGAVNMSHDDAFVALKSLLLILMTAVIGHSAAISVSLMAIRKTRFTASPQKNSVFIMGLIIIFLMAAVPSGFSKSGDITMHWYSLPVSVLDFYLFSAAFLLFWSVTGLYRSMRTELQEDNGPWVWITFLLTLLVYVNGITEGAAKEYFVDWHGNLFLWTSFATLSVIGYLAVLAESFDLVIIRKFIDRWHKKQFDELSLIIPLWLPALSGAMLFMALLFTSSFFDADNTSHAIFALAITLFVLRDLGVIGLIKSSGSNKADFYMVAYLGIAYFLLPMVTVLLNAKELAHIFWPFPDGSYAWQVLPVLLQVGVVVYLVIRMRAHLLVKG